MAQDGFVGQVQRVGTDSGLAPAESALIFDPASFAVADAPDTVVTGEGASVTGVSRVTLKAGALGSSFSLGTAPQQDAWSVVTGTTTATAAASTSIVKLFPIAGPGSTTVSFVAKARIDLLTTVSVFADVAACVGAVRPASGSPDPVVAKSDSVRTMAVVAPFGSGNVAATISGTSISITLDLGTIPAWVNTTGYDAGPAGSERHIVAHDGGKLYVCITAGVSAGSGGPTGTGSNITDGSVHWAYVGTSLTVVWTMVFDVRTG